MQLPQARRRAAIHAAWRVLNPGGTLLVIAHHLDNLHGGVGGPQDPEVLYRQQDVLADLPYRARRPDRRAERAARVVAGQDRPALDTLVVAGKT